MAIKRICSIVDCGKRAVTAAFPLCSMHYQRSAKGTDMHAPSHRQTKLVDAFFAQLLAVETDECIVWPFTRDPNGYATRKRKGQSCFVSRQVAIIKHGPPPDYRIYVAAHSCGKGHLGCVNYRHLRWATQLENMHDKLLHGTWLLGEQTGPAILTTHEVLEIKKLLAAGAKQITLAQRYGVGRSAISAIHRRLNWRHL